MAKRLKIGLGLAILTLVVIGMVATSGPPPPTPTPPGSFSFAVLGDAPYYPWETVQYRLVLQTLQAHDVSWVLHVGDIFWHPCTDEMYRRSLGWFNGLRHPVIFTPGDNEWADCWEQGSGGYDPLDRLQRIREIFFDHPARSLGGSSMPLVAQGGGGPFAEFVENARWTQEGILFATLNIPGSMNALETASQRTPAALAAAKRRMDAATAWVRESFAEATATGATAVVLAFHANPGFEELVGDPYREAYDPFIRGLEEETERFPRQVVILHGDGHDYTVDHPLTRRTTGIRLENLTRLQVPGSPEVGWVRVVVTPGPEPRFSFTKLVVPRWKYW